MRHSRFSRDAAPMPSPDAQSGVTREVLEIATLQVSGMSFATEKDVVERVLARRSGVRSVEANPVAQTATVRYDPAVTSISQLRSWIEECGFHCAGRSVPNHICDAMEEAHADSTIAPHLPEAAHRPTGGSDAAGDDGHDHQAATTLQSPHDAMGPGGPAGMSMDDMVPDMRHRVPGTAVPLNTTPPCVWVRC